MSEPDLISRPTAPEPSGPRADNAPDRAPPSPTVEATTIIEAAIDAILTLDDQRRVQSANPACQRLFGFSIEQLVGMPADRLLSDEKQCAVAHRMPVGDESSWECLARRADGQTIPVELAVSRLPHPEDPRQVVVIRDITRRKQLALQVQHIQKMESLGVMAAGVAHELNTPLQFLKANLQFLETAFEDVWSLVRGLQELQETKGEDREAAERRMAELLSEAADLDFLGDELPSALAESLNGVARAGAVVTAMREFACAESGGLQQVDLRQAVNNTLAVCGNQWRGTAEVITDFSADLPPVACSATDLHYAIFNIVVNAAQAIRERQETVSDHPGRIEISTRRRGNDAEVRIADNGCGIPEEIRAKIFDPFFTTKPVGVGSGQGLSVAYGAIVEKHGGQLTVESRSGEGSQFTLRIPLSPPTSTRGADRGTDDGESKPPCQTAAEGEHDVCAS